MGRRQSTADPAPYVRGWIEHERFARQRIFLALGIFEGGARLANAARVAGEAGFRKSNLHRSQAAGSRGRRVRIPHILHPIDIARRSVDQDQTVNATGMMRAEILRDQSAKRNSHDLRALDPLAAKDRHKLLGEIKTPYGPCGTGICAVVRQIEARE